MVADVLVDNLLGPVLLARLTNLEVSVETENCRWLVSMVPGDAAIELSTSSGDLLACCDRGAELLAIAAVLDLVEVDEAERGRAFDSFHPRGARVEVGQPAAHLPRLQSLHLV